MSTSLYSDRKDISRPIPCETCSTGLAFGSNHHCHRCLDEFFDGRIPSYCREFCEAAQIRVQRWYDADEAIRLACGERDIHHRYEGAICRRLQTILEAPVRMEEQARLIIEVDDLAKDIEFEHGYNITQRTLHALQVRLGRLLGASFSPRIPKRQAVSNRVGHSH